MRRNLDESRSWTAMRACGVLAAGLALTVPTALAGEPCHYTWVELQRPPGYLGHSTVAMNNLGHVTGTLQTGGDNRRSFLWTPETGMQVLPQPAGIVDVRASDINDHGHICGRLSLNGNGYRPFVWDGQNYTVIQIPDWANLAEAYGINNRGQVVGMVQNVLTEPTHAFVWEAGQFTDLGEFAGSHAYFAQNIDARGRIAGYFAQSNPSVYRSFIVENGQSLVLPLPEGSEGTRTTGMNDRNTVVGYAIRATNPPSRDPRGLLWFGFQPTIVDLPAPLTELLMMTANTADRIVGTADKPDSPTFAVVWQSDVVTELRSLMVPEVPPGWIANDGRDINTIGQILTSRYVLTPIWRPGDLTGDCRVTLEDLALLLLDFGSSFGSYPRGDVDVDGDVDLADLAVLLTHWGD